MRKKRFLFIGGPLHAQHLEVESTEFRAFVGAMVDAAPDADDVNPDDAYPAVITRLDYATNYHKRTAAHAVNGPDGTPSLDGYKLTFYVWEGVTNADDANLQMSDAIAHQYFVEHGTKADVAPPRPASRIIVPGRN